jgi:hypothetical protein
VVAVLGRATAVGEAPLDLLAALLCGWRPIISPAAPFLAGGVPEQEPKLHRDSIAIQFYV